MTKRKVLVPLTAALVLGAVAAGGSLRSALAANENWKGVTLIYQTDVKGKIEPCG